jgi:cell division protein FtsB
MVLLFSHTLINKINKIMKTIKTFILNCFLFSSLMGFSQNNSKAIFSNDKQKQEMILEFIALKNNYEKQIENNYDVTKKGSMQKSELEKLSLKNIELKKNMDDKILDITVKYNISKKDLYLIVSEFIKNEKK